VIKLTKTEQVKRWLESGKKIRQHTAKTRFNAERLAVIIERLKHRGMWIINVGEPGKHANYIMLEKGPIKNLMIKGYKLNIEHAFYYDGFKYMQILIYATNGVRQKIFHCNSDAFRDKKIMEKCILNA
jgi:hypothetical protein